MKNKYETNLVTFTASARSRSLATLLPNPTADLADAPVAGTATDLRWGI